MLKKHHAHLELPKLPPSNFSMIFKDSIWHDDIFLNTNAKTNILCIFYLNELSMKKLQAKKLSNV
jgi:hypothetical protein